LKWLFFFVPEFISLVTQQMNKVDFHEFIESLDLPTPPNAAPMLLALWHDGRGNCEKAHNIIQDINGSMACWIHAYLHRKEGDLGNAGYWYSRAGKVAPPVELEMEWEQLVKELL
jgi:hypothetical protein